MHTWHVSWSQGKPGEPGQPGEDGPKGDQVHTSKALAIALTFTTEQIYRAHLDPREKKAWHLELKRYNH